MVARYDMTINGQRASGACGLEVINPATEQVVAVAPDCSPTQLDEAVAAARRAFPAWREAPWSERSAAVLALADALEQARSSLKEILTAEQGKPIADADAEIGKALEWLRSMAAMSLPPIINEASPQRRSETHFVPIGVVGAIAPWNFPVALAVWKLAPALIAGNTIVLKPSPFTPLTTLKMGEIATAVLPRGVVNVVSGSERLGAWMTSHAGIDKISFTGSTATGRRVMAGAAERLKRITLELGGNDAAVVMPDVDVEATAQRIFWDAFRNGGQVCIASKRLYVHVDIYEEMAAALVDIAAKVKVGNGAEPGTQIGPVQNERQFHRILDLVGDAKNRGCHFLCGGEQIVGRGYFIPITLIDNPPEDARIVSEEQFGPVAPLLKFSSVDEVVSRVNASPYGLGATVWCADRPLASEIARRLDVGTVWINHNHFTSPTTPFGGRKQSGFGVENGALGLSAYTHVKTIVAGQP